MSRKRLYFDEILNWSAPRNLQGLQKAIKDSQDFLCRLELERKLKLHNGCVNTIAWNERGTLLLSGSDDHNLVISNPFNFSAPNTINTPHTANIFSAKFLSGCGDTKLVSCAGDGLIVYTDVNKYTESSTLRCHTGTVYEMLSVPGDSHSFLSCGEDGTVRWFDTRVQTSCTAHECTQDIMIQCERGISTISLNPVFSYQLAVGGSDACVRVYDRRMLCTKQTNCDKSIGLSGLVSKFSVPELEGKPRRITSVDFRPDGQEILASYSSDYLYIFNPKDDETKKGKRLKVGRPSTRKLSNKSSQQNQQPMKKLRLRGDWSDTGPNSRPETEVLPNQRSGGGAETDRASGQAALMQRMTFALSRMLNDPGTRLAMQRLNVSREGSTGPAQNQPNLSPRRSEEEIVEEIRDSMNLGNNEGPSGGRSSTAETRGVRSSTTGPSAASGITDRQSAAAAIQERWRQYRERKLQERRQTVIEVSAVDEGSAASIVHVSSAADQQGVLESGPPQGAAQESVEGEQERMPSPEGAVRESTSSREGAAQESVPSLDGAARESAPSREEASQKSVLSLDGAARESTSSQGVISMESVSIGDVTTKESLPSSEGALQAGESGPTESAQESEPVHSAAAQDCSPSHLDIGGPPALIDDSDDNLTDMEDNEDEEQPSTSLQENLESLESSYTTLRDTGVEPTLQFRYGGQGVTASSIEVNTDPLPGPRRVVTGPGQVGIDPVTGLRRRRTGVSSVSTSSILYEEKQSQNQGIVEYESEECTDSEEDESDDIPGRAILQPPVLQKLSGHRNVRTMIKEATWWGNNHVLSGSDCGHFFGWNRNNGEIVLMKEADRHVVNCLQPHPFLPVLATSGIDYDVKLWTPTAPESTFNKESVDVVVRRNEVMLEETRDTITVPASLMIRMLASLNQIRRGQLSPREPE